MLSLPPVLQTKTLKRQHRSLVFQQNRPKADLKPIELNPLQRSFADPEPLVANPQSIRDDAHQTGDGKWPKAAATRG